MHFRTFFAALSARAMAALDLDQPSFHGKNSGRTLPRRNARWSERRAVLYQRPPSGEFARVLEMTEDQDARGPGEEAPHRCEGHRITDIRHAGLLRLRRREQTARGAVGSWNWGAGASFIHQLYAPEVQSPGLYGTARYLSRLTMGVSTSTVSPERPLPGDPTPRRSRRARPYAGIASCAPAAGWSARLPDDPVRRSDRRP